MKFTKDWLSDHLSTSKSEKQIIEKLNKLKFTSDKNLAAWFMILAKVFSKIFKDGGIILICSENQKYICGSPRQIDPITLKLLKKEMNWSIFLTKIK